MKVFFEFFSQEVKRAIKGPGLYINYFLFFGLGILSGLLGSGKWKIGLHDTNEVITSAYAISNLMLFFDEQITIIWVGLLAISYISSSILRDHDYNVLPFIYTKPIQTWQYLCGKFFGSFSVLVIISSGLIVGYYLACVISRDMPLVQDLNIVYFLVPYFKFTIPSLFILSLLLFIVSLYTKSNIANYIAIILVIASTFLTSKLLSQIDYKTYTVFTDPFAVGPFTLLTEFWSPNEKNTLPIELKGDLLLNRSIWLGIFIFIGFIAFKAFSFSRDIIIAWWPKRKGQISSRSFSSLDSISTLKETTGHSNRSKELLYLSMFEFKRMIKSPFFLICTGLGVLGSFANYFAFENTYEIKPYAFSFYMSGATLYFEVLLSIYLFFISGTYIWRDKRINLSGIIHSTKVSDFSLFTSKLFALIMIILSVASIRMITGIIIQWMGGYYLIDLPYYLFTFFVMDFLSPFIVGCFCLSIHFIFGHRVIGYSITLFILYVLPIILGLLQWTYPLYWFNMPVIKLPYSHFNGFGPDLSKYFIYKGYWLFFVLIMVTIAVNSYPRILGQGIFSRLKYGFKVKYMILSVLLLTLSMIATGIYIDNNIRIKNKYYSQKKIEEILVNREKKYKQYESLNSLTLNSVDFSLDLFPESEGLKVKCINKFINESNKPIDTIFVDHISEFKNINYAFNKNISLISKDSLLGVNLYVLEHPILPYDSLQCDINFEYFTNGFSHDGSHRNEIYKNGTFLDNNILPEFFYNSNYELNDNKKRKKHGLLSKERINSLSDTSKYYENMFGKSANWINFKCTVSTSEDQTIVVPGYLEKKWIENKRAYYQYRMDKPILNFYSIVSGKYKTTFDRWADTNSAVDIEILHHPTHDYNTMYMMDAIKQSLDYYSHNFGSYPHKLARIIEFPRYRSFAQSFPTTIPFSESMGFTQKFDSTKNNINFPFFVTAHEMAHQWWGHQLVSANVQGAFTLSESLSEYSALMVFEKKYGSSAVREVLKYEMDGYLRARTFEAKKEVPLIKNENQQYLSYRKGAIVMYALKESIGEQKVNEALKNLIMEYGNKKPPYSTTYDLLKCLRNVTPDSLQFLISDLFESIIIYDNEIKESKVSRNPDSSYNTIINLDCRKISYNEVGKGDTIHGKQFIDIAILGNDYSDKSLNVIYLKKYLLHSGDTTISIRVTETPIKVSIDPYKIFIEKDFEDNTKIINNK